MKKYKMPVLLSAAFGGVTPNLLRLAIGLTNETAELPGISYLLGLLIFAIVGALVALIWEETDLKKAFYLGLGLPAFIQVGMGEVSSSALTAVNVDSSHRLVMEQPAAGKQYRTVPTAFLQDTTAATPHVRKLRITLEKYWPRCVVIFSSPDSTLETILEFPEGQQTRTIDIPDFATGFQMQIRKSLSPVYPLPSDKSGVFAFRVSWKKGFWSGFWQAIGFKDGEELEVIVQPEERSSPQE